MPGGSFGVIGAGGGSRDRDGGLCCCRGVGWMGFTAQSKDPPGQRELNSVHRVRWAGRAWRALVRRKEEGGVSF